MIQYKDSKNSKEKEKEEKDPRDRRIIIKGDLFINYKTFEKKPSERIVLNEVRKKYNENKRKIFKSYKSNSSFGLMSKSMKDIGSLLKRADMIEIEIASLK